MKIGIGADHRGFKKKEFIKKILFDKGYDVKDFGTDNEESCDYPDIAFSLANEVATGRVEKGILICNTGIGMSITANKVKGVYAALCCNEDMASAARRHNNSNVLALGASLVSDKEAEKIVLTWLKGEFEGGRHRRRFEKIRKRELE
ncbi:MAG: ribose 5-phosphate isomerase B [Candidatus Cloacimonas sp. 4484_209]|nr:MAG: ribose 5-phosphate isomerase B [Candidatus Cloacimonas sp. 4484_209]